MMTNIESAAKKKFRRFDCTLIECIRETPDTATLVLATKENRDYRAGQFVSIDPGQFPALARWARFLEKLKGRKEPPRMYSLASAPFEEHLAVTIKEEEYFPDEDEYPPLLSPFLAHRITVGTPVTVMGYAGHYHLPDRVEDLTDHIVHICSGSGVVPNYGMIKQALHDNLKIRHTLFYGNKRFEDIIYFRQFEALANRHPDKVRIIHAITREDNPERRGSAFRKGRISDALIREAVTDIAAPIFFCCGSAVSAWQKKRHREKGTEPTPKFMDTLIPLLESMGVRKDRIFKESW